MLLTFCKMKSVWMCFNSEITANMFSVRHCNICSGTFILTSAQKGMCLSFSSVNPSAFMSEAESQSCDSKPGSCCLCRCDEDPDPEVQVSSAYLLKWICEFFLWQAPVQDSFQRWFITKTVLIHFHYFPQETNNELLF